MSNAEKRHILAATYGNEFGDDAYVIVEVYPDVVDIVLAAQRLAREFNKNPVLEGYFHSGSRVTTPEIGYEFVFKSLPDPLDEWISTQEHYDTELPRLLPVNLDPMLETIKEAHRLDASVRWDSRPARYQCEDDSVRLQIFDRYECDICIWTRDLLPFFTALQQDFDTPGCVAGLEDGGDS